MTQPRPTMHSFWRRRAGPVAAGIELDPADMGTCFGLEMCLDRLRLPAEPARSAAEPAPWWERAGARRAFGA